MTWWRVEEDGSLDQIVEATGEYNIVNVAVGERVRNSTLVVINSQPSDAGTYLCQAENVFSTDSATVNLTVYGEPPIATNVIIWLLLFFLKKEILRPSEWLYN